MSDGPTTRDEAAEYTSLKADGAEEVSGVTFDAWVRRKRAEKSFDTPHCVHGNDARACRACYECKPVTPPVGAALGVAQGDKPYPNLFKHWITTVYAAGMPDVPDEFTRADMAKAFDAGCARYNDLLTSCSECRAELTKARDAADSARRDASRWQTRANEAEALAASAAAARPASREEMIEAVRDASMVISERSRMAKATAAHYVDAVLALERSPQPTLSDEQISERAKAMVRHIPDLVEAGALHFKLLRIGLWVSDVLSGKVKP